MTQRIDQVLAGFAEGDAISNEAMILQDIARGWGMPSDVFVDPKHASSRLEGRWRSLYDYSGSPRDVLIHHYSISSPAVDVFRSAAARKVMIYHNITPAHFYRGYDNAIAAQLDVAREGMRELLPHMDGVWADSDFNAGELREMGSDKATVLPLLFSPAQFDQPADPRVFAKFAVPMTNILYVGRLAPHKYIEGLLEAFAWYYHTINKRSRLIIVGSERSAWRYFVMLQMYTRELNLPTVYFEEYVTAEALSAYYEVADAFVTCSLHEGYCLPLVEAMHRDVPVIARRMGGMPEALGGGGVMFEDADARELAVLMDRVLTDAGLKQDVLASQRKRMDAVRTRRGDEEFRALLDQLPARPGA